MRRDDPARAEALLADIAGFALTARRVVSRGRDRFFDPEDDDQRRIARSLAVDLSTAADRLPDSFRHVHDEVNWRGIRALRNVVAHDYLGTDNEVLWEVLASRFPEITRALGIE